MSNETLQVKIQPLIAIVNKQNLYLDGRYDTVEEAISALSEMKKDEPAAQYMEVLEGFELIAEGRYQHLDDALPFYENKEQAIEHFHQIKGISHISEAVDTEGHTYECVLCGFHYYALEPDLEWQDCPSLKELIEN